MRAAAIQLAPWGILLLAIGLTRLPSGGGIWGIACIAGMAMVSVLAALRTFWSKAPRSVSGGLFAASLAVLLVPPSPTALLDWVPAWVVAVLYALTLHLAFQDSAGRAPRLAGNGEPGRAAWLRYLPLGLGLVALVALPFAKILLPLRIRAVFELQTALEPLAALALVGSLLVVGGLAWTALERRPKSSKPSTASLDAAAPVPEDSP